MDPVSILEKIAVPRPNHSPALEQVANYIKQLLTSWDIPFAVQQYSLRHHAFALLGVAVVILAVLFFISIARKRPLFALLFLLAIPVLVITEVEYYQHTVTALLQRPAENIVMDFESPDAVRQLVFAAHYDSKTDFWDHIQRARITRLFPFFILLGLVVTLVAFLAGRLAVLQKKPVRLLTLALAALIVVYSGYAFSWLGGYVLMDDDSSSPGAVDDGAGVVVLLTMARDIHEGRVDIGDSNVTILLSSGEEVGMQGALQFVRERYIDAKPSLPSSLVNLELAGQNGNMIYWSRVGTLIRFYPADTELIKRLDRSWKEISGNSMDMRDKLGDDSKRFAMAGVPFVTVGHSGLPGRGLGDFHSTHDNMQRVNPENITNMVKTLERYIENYDRHP